MADESAHESGFSPEITRTVTTSEHLKTLKQELNMPLLIYNQFESSERKGTQGRRDLSQEQCTPQHQDTLRNAAELHLKAGVDERTGLVVQEVLVHAMNEVATNKVFEVFSDFEDCTEDPQDILARVSRMDQFLTQEYSMALRLGVVQLQEEKQLTVANVRQLAAEAALRSEGSMVVQLGGDGEQTKESNDYSVKIARSRGLVMSGIDCVNSTAFYELGRKLAVLSVMTGSPVYEDQVNKFAQDRPSAVQVKLGVEAKSRQDYEDQIRVLADPEDLKYLNDHGIAITTGAREKSGDEFTHLARKHKQRLGGGLESMSAEDIVVIQKVLKQVSHTEFTDYLPADLQRKKDRAKSYFGDLCAVGDENYKLWFGVRYSGERLDVIEAQTLDEGTAGITDTSELMQTYSKRSFEAVSSRLDEEKKGDIFANLKRAIVARDPVAQMYMVSVIQQRRAEDLINVGALMEELRAITNEGKADQVDDDYYENVITPAIQIAEKRRDSDQM